MTYYDIMFESINEQYENGEITFEQAEELNQIAYDRYMTETSKTSKEKRDRLYYKVGSGEGPKGKQGKFDELNNIQDIIAGSKLPPPYPVNFKKYNNERDKRSFRYADRYGENPKDKKSGRRSMPDEPMIQNKNYSSDDYDYYKVTPKNDRGRYYGKV